ncbi:MAG: putative Ig domain-containing protein [Nitrosomonadales bacterium]|nr:putative Ig domain-containing protein [Nitrosomonadales bacterium]
MRTAIRFIAGLAAVLGIALAGCSSGGGGGGGGGAGITATANTTAQILTVGTAMPSFTPLTASGGATPYTYSYTGTLPAGLTFNTATGAVTGTPTAAYATASLVFSVQDAGNAVASTTSIVSFTVVTSNAPCTSQTLSWVQNGQICSATSGSGTSGNPVSLTDSTGTTGTASFTCNNGSWGVAVNPLCAAEVIPVNATVTDVQILNTGVSNQSNVPVTFGQVFRAGDLAATESLVGVIGTTTVPLQVEVKATHPDGTARHAIISAIIPTVTTTPQLMILKKTPAATNTPASPVASGYATGGGAGFTASVNVTIGGVPYTASADSLLAGSYSQWLGGSIANEWEVSTPLLKVSDASPHPNLTARFAIRAYSGLSKARVDVTIENDTVAWNGTSFGPAAQAFTYDASIVVGGTPVYSVAALKHYKNARWRKVYWWNGAPEVDVKPNLAYWMASKAVPNYDTTVNPAPGITSLNTKWTAASATTNLAIAGPTYVSSTGNYVGQSGYTADANNATGPMGIGIVSAYMPLTGGRPEIGPLPQWAAVYMLSGDTSVKNIVNASGDLAGGWPIHYRDANTGFPLSITDYPFAGISCGTTNCTRQPAGIVYQLPLCIAGAGDCTTPFVPDSAHQAALAYLPYLLTGDYYYLEELQFWSTWNLLKGTPVYRHFDQGLVVWDQVRGMAWTIRTLAQTAAFTPDSQLGSTAPKTYYTSLITNNINWYNDYAATHPSQLGALGDLSYPSYLYDSITRPAKDFSGTGIGAFVYPTPVTRNGALETATTFTGTGSGTTLTATGVLGYIYKGSSVTGTGVPANTTIVSQVSGTTGSDGVYTTNNATTSSGNSLTANIPAYTGIAPWQDDFLTWSFNNAVQLGYTSATTIANFKSAFPIGRMTSGADFCWIDGARYNLTLRDTIASPMYSTWAAVTAGNFSGLTEGGGYLAQGCGTPAQATWLSNIAFYTLNDNLPFITGQMPRYSTSAAGYPSNMQPALAVSVDNGATNASAAWLQFQARTVKPNYSTEPQWAIVPR